MPVLKRLFAAAVAVAISCASITPSHATDRRPIAIINNRASEIPDTDTARFGSLKVTTGTTDIQADVQFSGDISPSQITSDQNDYNPTGLSAAAVLRLSTDASRNLTGLQGGADGRWITIVNVGSFNLVLKNASSSSSAANRFALDADLTMAANTSAVLGYDATSLRWRLLGIGKATAASGVTSVAVSSSDSTLAINSGSPVTGAGTIDLSVLKWKTARTLTLGTDLSGSVSFDGSTNSTLNAALVNSGAAAGSYTCINGTVDSKGRLTSVSSGGCGGGSGVPGFVNATAVSVGMASFGGL